MSQAEMFHTDKRRLDNLISEAARTQVEHEQDTGDTQKRQTASESDMALHAYWQQFDRSLVPGDYKRAQYFREKERWRKEYARGH